MTPPMTLADRIEGLDGPSREVDAEIFRAIGAPVPFQFANKLIALEFNDVEQAYFARVSDDMQVRFSPPAYTASLDAAMTLVPKGWGASFHFSEDRPDCELHCTIRLGRSYPFNAEVYAERSGKFGHKGTLALALCAAALRAQEAERRGR